MVAQSAGVNGRWDEVVAEGVHRHQRGHPDGVAEVVGVTAAGQCRARRGLGRDEPSLDALANPPPKERIGDAGEVRAASDAADHHVRGLPASSICLMHSWPITVWCRQTWLSTEPRVVYVLGSGGDLDGLGDRDPQAAGLMFGL